MLYFSSFATRDLQMQQALLQCFGKERSDLLLLIFLMFKMGSVTPVTPYKPEHTVNKVPAMSELNWKKKMLPPSVPSPYFSKSTIAILPPSTETTMGTSLAANVFYR